MKLKIKKYFEIPLNPFFFHEERKCWIDQSEKTCQQLKCSLANVIAKNIS